MSVQVKDILIKRAREVAEYLIALQVPCHYSLLDYGINFHLKHEQRKVTLSLSYSPTKNTWKAQSDNSWVKITIIPRIQALLVAGNTSAPLSDTVLSPAHTTTAPSRAMAYFAEALESFRILQPFEQEYIDFSIVGEYAREGVRRVLSDTSYQDLDRTSLQAALEFPLCSDFSTIKEYLLRCLTLCRIPTSL